MITINDWLKSSSLKLKKTSSSPFIDAEIILMHILKISREKIILNPNLIIKKQQLNKLNELIKKRVKAVPIAYLVENKSFYGLDFFVNNNVLIPRPESETIIEISQRIIKPINNPTVVELGIGSGALLISLVKTQQSKIMATGYDISQLAINVAKKNSRHLGVSKTLTFKKSDLLNKWPKEKTIDLVIANLPYLPKDYLKKHKSLAEIGLKFEPKISLFSGEDGLDLYRKLQKQLSVYHVNNLVIELLPQQIKNALTIFTDNLHTCEIVNDLGGTPRFIHISKI